MLLQNKAMLRTGSLIPHLLHLLTHLATILTQKAKIGKEA